MRTEGIGSLAGVQFYTLSQEPVDIILVDGVVCAGFPSPADDHLQSRIDLNRELIRNPDATFGIWVDGDSMQDDGIESGDLLLVDKSIDPFNRALAVCVLNGEFTLKRVEKTGRLIRLLPANPAFQPIEVHPDDELLIWGIVTYVIKKA